jgi:hypothetical protein
MSIENSPLQHDAFVVPHDDDDAIGLINPWASTRLAMIFSSGLK